MSRWLKDFIKRTIFSIGGFFFRKKKPVPSSVNRVLFISLFFSGDLLFHTPAIKYIKARFPGVKLDVWVKSRASQLLFNNPDVSDIFVFDDIKTADYGENPRLNLWEKYKFIKKLRAQKYDIVVDFTGLYSTAFFTRLTGSKFTAGRNVQGFGFIYDKFIDLNVSTTPGSLVGKYLRIVKDMFPSDIDVPPVPVLNIDEETKKIVDRELRSRDIFPGKPLICLHLTAGWEAKRWSLMSFALLIAQLINKYGYNVVIVGHEKDREEVNKITLSLKDTVSPEKLKNLFIALPFMGTAEVINRADVFIGSDSAPLHIAGALGTPSIGLFGPTNPDFSNPVGEKHKVLYHILDCSAKPHLQYCTRDAGKTCLTVECMTLIKVPDVLQMIELLLQKYSSTVK